ncbi:MAG: hypothetical protein WBB27_15380, partial [Maribacter sp.]
MNEKKLDEFFQDKFMDFKEIPDEKVWSSIEASLDKKKRNRIIPLWWQLGGIAAALLIGVILINPFGSTDPNKVIVTDVEQTNNKIDSTTIENSIKGTVPQKDIQEEVQIAVDGEKSSITEKTVDGVVNASEKTKEKNKAEPNGLQKKTPLVNEALSSKNSEVVEAKSSIQTEKEIKNSTQKTGLTKNVIDETAIAVSETQTKKDATEKSITKTSNTSPVPNETVLKNKTKETGIASFEKEEKEEAIEDSKKKSIFEEIEVQEEKAIVENSDKKWSAGPSIAPVYFNAIGEGSPVHSIFVPNSKSGNVNLSYGLSVAYEVSSKLKIRSGIHRVDYGYNTNDVEFSSSLSSSTNEQISSINYVATSKNLVVTSKSGGNANQDFSNSSIDISAQNPSRDGVMSQQLGYLEVPLELNYALIDNRFGVNIIGGVSSLFLLDNSVALTS